MVTPTPASFFIVIVGFFALMAYIGYLSNKKTKTLQDFFVMSGKAGVLMSGFAYFATQYSMSTFMGVPGTVYHAGYAGMTVSVPGLAFSMIIPVLFVGRKLIFLGRRHGFLTMGDYLGDRYESSALQTFLAVMMLVLMVPMMGVQMIGAGIIFTTYTGYPAWIGVVITGLVVISYCMAGGIRGAMTTDIIQGGLMVATAITAFAVSVQLGGGLDVINEKLFALDPGYLTHPGRDGRFPILGYVSMIVMWSFFTIGQPQLFTKFFSMKNYSVMFKAVLLGTMGMWFSATLIEWVGANGAVSVPGLMGKDSDFIVPLVLQKGVSPWIAALMVAGIFSAGMSTVSSILIVTSSALSRDLYQKVLVKSATDDQTLRVSRCVTLIIGLLAIAFGIWRPGSIFSLILLVVGGWGIWVSAIILGMYWKRANKYGVFAGVITGELVYLYLKTSAPWFGKAFPGLETVIPSFFIACLVLVVVSLMTPPTGQETLARHFNE